MRTSLIFSSFSLIYVILIAIVFIVKQKVKNVETKVYSMIIKVTIFELSIELISTLLNTYLVGYDGLKMLSLKLIVVSFFCWLYFFMLYIYNISKEENNNKLRNRNFFTFTFLIINIIILFLPIYSKIDNGVILYTYGPAVTFLYIILLVLLTVMIILLIKYRKKIGNKRLIPLYIFLTLGIIVVIIQYINPSLLLNASLDAFITILMYFTIENPDMKMLSELNKSKEISDKANEEKTIFLYNMTQDIKEITNKIDEDTNIILESKDIDQIYDITRDIKSNSSKFITLTNDVFDVSMIDQANIKVYNCKYNIKLLIKEIINVYSKLCNEKELEFITNIDNNIPNSLYGDSINLKDVLNKIITNSIKNTNKGFIEFDINTIIKNDICRLIINIEDSSNGIKSEDINKILLENTELGEVNKIVTLIGGTMIVSSNYGFGNKIKIIIDQKINIEEDSNIKKYEEVFDNTKILVIDDSDSSIKIINKLLKSTNVIMDSSLNGKDAINNIKANKYDLILLDEDLSSINGKDLLIKIKEIRGFNSRVILLTKDNNYEYNDKYLEEGFSDYLLKPIKKDKLLDIIDKYKKG